MKPIKYITVLLLLATLTSCWKEWGLCHDTELSFKKKDYTGTELRTDGYYYNEDTSEFGSVDLIYLFRNGVFYPDVQQLEDAKYGTITTPTTSSHLVSKRKWGAFRVSGNIIEIEKWWAITKTCFRTTYIKGEIQNDTTFIITRIEDRRKKGKPESVETPNTTYHFHAFSPKPDSTNDFVH